MRYFFYFSFLLFFSNTLFSQGPKWVNYVNDHLIYDVAVEDNYLWVGSQGGLMRIDRQTQERQLFLPANSGFRGNGVRSICIAPNGDKWIGGEYGGLLRFDGTDWEQYYYIGTGDTLIQIIDVRAAPNGDIWFLSNVHGNGSGHTKLFKFDGTTFTNMNQVFGPFANNAGLIYSYDIASNGDAWAIAEFKLQRYAGGSVMDVQTDADAGLLPEERFKYLITDENGEVWVSTYRYIPQVGHTFRMLRYDGSAWHEEGFLGNTTNTGSANTFFKDLQNNLWCSYSLTTSSETIYAKYNGQTWEVVPVDNYPGLSAGSGPPNLLEVDAQGHLWALSYSGIHNPKVYELDGGAWKGYHTEIYPLFSNYFDDVAVDCDGKTWFGGRGLNIFDGTSWQEIKSWELDFGLGVWSMTMDTVNCRLWLSSYSINTDYSLVSFDGGVFKTYNVGGSAFHTAIAPDGTVWAATQEKGVGRFDGADWTWYNSSNSPLNDWVYDVVVDHAGGVWVSSYGNGIAHWDGSTWQVFNEFNSPVGKYIQMLYVDLDGLFWTHTAGGLLRYDGTNWQFFAMPQNFYESRDMTQDQYGIYWIATDAGAVRWDGTDMTIYEVANSPIGMNYVTRIHIDPYGNKWFVHSQGVTVFNENGISNQLLNPPNSVRGQVFFDTDQNGGMAGTGEPGIPGEKILLLPDSVMTYSSFGGHYAFYTSPGAYEIALQPDVPYVPTTASPLALLMAEADQTGYDFGAWSATPPDSISVDLTAGNARCNETTTLWIHVTNFGLFDAGGTITLQFDPALSFLSASQTPQSVQGNIITWDYEGLSPYEYDPIKVTFQSPSEDAVGDILYFSVTATRQEGGQLVQTARDNTSTEVRCSFDPNDKKAEATGDSQGEYSLLNDPLDYTIRFQNKGNDTAFIVVIRDTLDVNLDAASFELLAFSHPVRTTMAPGGVLTFFFENIDLLWEATNEPESHGFVKYRISPKAGLPDPTLIENTAHIFFDFNPAIVTNTTGNVLVETLPPSLVDEAGPSPAVSIFPNPSNGSFWIAPSSINPGPWQVHIYDLSGRLVQDFVSQSEQTKVEGLGAGFYLVVLEQEGRRATGKVVVGR